MPDMRFRWWCAHLPNCLHHGGTRLKCIKPILPPCLQIRSGRFWAVTMLSSTPAGLTSDGDRFVSLVAHIVSGLETMEPPNRPVAWFMAGAGRPNIGATRRRGLELPLIKKTYWPHGENFKRLEASALDFRLLCPGPMVEGAAVGLERLRVAI